MTSDSDSRIEELFHAALEHAPEERERFLTQACGDDMDLLGEVNSLLKARTKAPDFPEKPAWAGLVRPAASEVAEDLEAEPGLPFERLGEYRLIRKLGEGGMGIVYLAVQESLGRPACLKIIRQERIGSFPAEARFSREIEAISELRHSSIVTVFGSGEDQGVRYFAMEYLPGRGLDEVLGEASSRGERVSEIVEWIRNVALALDCAHRAGIIHRDVKPSNIRISPEGGAKLLDFSVARHVNLSTLTLTGEFCGTPHYASPEQIKAQQHGIDGRTDIHSLGVTLYEAITGRLPFMGETTEQVFHQILEKEPVPPRRLNPSIPRDLETVILTAVEKEPDRRYPTMADFAEDLRRLFEGEMILAKPSGFATKVWKRIKRNPAVSTAIGAALVAAAALAISIPFYLAQKTSKLCFSDTKLLSRLRSEAEALWPAFPEKSSEMEEWLQEAAVLAGRLGIHEKALRELKLSGRPQGENRIFDKSSDQRLHDTLAELVAGLKIFSKGERSAVKSVEKRLRFAQTVYTESVEKRKTEWERAVASIADRRECPLYDGLVIDPIVGFVPLGRDPASGLWEFAHLQTGNVPERGVDGKILYQAENGLVFVLIPGGTFNMGAARPGAEGALNPDTRAKPEEGPIHAVTVRPFLLSKYETTQDQWLRFTGNNPSIYGLKCRFGDKKHSLLHPVENVSWEDSKMALFRLGLRFPTEAEWEYAARAGTTTPWWTGVKKESLSGTINIIDLFYKEHGGITDMRPEEWLNDGYVAHAPVDHYKPNPFGLHSVCGNVMEWCEDIWHSNYTGAPADGSAWIDGTASIRVCRGGCWDSEAALTRTARRLWHPPDYRDCGLGVRPAFSLP